MGLGTGQSPPLLAGWNPKLDVAFKWELRELQAGSRGCACHGDGWGPWGSGVGLREAQGDTDLAQGTRWRTVTGRQAFGSVFTPSSFMVDFLCGRRRWRYWERLRSPLLGARCMPVFVSGGGCVQRQLYSRALTAAVSQMRTSGLRGVKSSAPNHPAVGCRRRFKSSLFKALPIGLPTPALTHTSRMICHLPRALLGGRCPGPGLGGRAPAHTSGCHSPRPALPPELRSPGPGLQGCRQPARGLYHGTEAPGLAPRTVLAPQVASQ